MSDSLVLRFDDVFKQTSRYFDKLIQGGDTPLRLADTLNSEVPIKMEDIRRTLVAVLEECLSESSKQIADGLRPELAIRYYNDRVESSLVAGCSLPLWEPWRPTLSECAQRAGTILAGGLGVGAVLAALKAAGLTSAKLPVYAGSPGATAAILAALACLSAVVPRHPTIMLSFMQKERSHATKHAAAYLETVRLYFLRFAHDAQRALDYYFKELQVDSASSK